MRIQRQYSGKERGRKVERLIAEECKKRKVSLTELRSGSRRGEIPAVRAEVSRKLVEDYGITIAEIARQVGYPHLPFQRACSQLFQLVNNVAYFPTPDRGNVNHENSWPKCLIGGFVGTIAGGPGHLGAGQKRNYAPVRKFVEPPLSGRREVTISETNRGAVRQLDAGNRLCCVLIAKETDRHL